LALVAMLAVVPVAMSAVARSRATANHPAKPAAPSGADASLQTAQADANAAAARRAAAASVANPVDSTVRARARAAVFTPPPRPSASFGVARLSRPAALRARPGGRVVAQLTGGTEFGTPQVLSVARRRGLWLGVAATALPNGRLGWLRRDDPSVSLRRVRYSLHADLSARTLELRRGTHRVIRFSVAVGRPGATTPVGRFAVTDKLSGSRFGPYYGCCILALSGHQPHLPAGWHGGDRLAIHGTDAPASIGRASSAGCLRAANRDLQVLMRRVPLGTPVFIRR
jgi:L,D-transpeptidase catalytic domain